MAAAKEKGTITSKEMADMLRELIQAGRDGQAVRALESMNVDIIEEDV